MKKVEHSTNSETKWAIESRRMSSSSSLIFSLSKSNSFVSCAFVIISSLHRTKSVKCAFVAACFLSLCSSQGVLIFVRMTSDPTKTTNSAPIYMRPKSQARMIVRSMPTKQAVRSPTTSYLARAQYFSTMGILV